MKTVATLALAGAAAAAPSKIRRTPEVQAPPSFRLQISSNDTNLNARPASASLTGGAIGLSGGNTTIGFLPTRALTYGWENMITNMSLNAGVISFSNIPLTRNNPYYIQLGDMDQATKLATAWLVPNPSPEQTGFSVTNSSVTPGVPVLNYASGNAQAFPLSCNVTTDNDVLYMLMYAFDQQTAGSSPGCKQIELQVASSS